jgi:2-polyprenyl-3-methyl-5-hydroxy-6-metoxy-1,4-benzoquinol methylase
MADAPSTWHEKRAVQLKERIVDLRDPLLVESWDANVAVRAAELSSHSDPAYQALIDLILGFLKEKVSPGSLVLDAGCGLGYLANAMAQTEYIVHGIDPSQASIDCAKKAFDIDKLSFAVQRIEDLAAESDCESKVYDAVIANMVLHTTPNLKSFLSSTATLLRPGGVFIATIPHPYFFLQTKEFISPDDDHPTDRPYWIKFRIRGREPHEVPVPYFHRTIADYSEGLYIAGLEEVHIYEPGRVGPGRSNDIFVVHAAKPSVPRFV